MNESILPKNPRASDERGFLPWTLAGLVGLIVVTMGWVVLAPRGPAVRVAVAGAGSTSGISAFGFVGAPLGATLSARVPGRIQQIAAAEGSVVRQGQIIATLEAGDYQTGLEGARQAVSQAELEVAQAKNSLALAEGQRQTNSDLDLEKLRIQQGLKESALQQARAHQAIAEANLAHTSVRAPFAGTLLRWKVRPGDVVTPSAPLATLADLGSLDADVEVSQAVVGQIKEGEAARITVDAYPRTYFRGRVRQVGPAADRPDGGITIDVSFVDLDRRILPGMSARVEFGDAVAGVLVPQSALVQDDQSAYVWLVVDGRAHAHTVELGPGRGNRVEIRNGLSGGEIVILDPPRLHEGSRVRVSGS